MTIPIDRQPLVNGALRDVLSEIDALDAPAPSDTSLVPNGAGLSQDALHALEVEDARAEIYEAAEAVPVDLPALGRISSAQIERVHQAIREYADQAKKHGRTAKRNKLVDAIRRGEGRDLYDMQRRIEYHTVVQQFEDREVRPYHRSGERQRSRRKMRLSPAEIEALSPAELEARRQEDAEWKRQQKRESKTRRKAARTPAEIAADKAKNAQRMREARRLAKEAAKPAK